MLRSLVGSEMCIRDSRIICGPYLLWPNGWMDQDETWRGGSPWLSPNCVKWGPGSPYPKGTVSPKFSAMSVVAKRLDGSRCSLEIGMVVGLGPGHNVLDGDPAPLPQRGTAPNFRSMSVVAKQLDGSRCHLVGGRPWPWPHCVRWGPTSPKGAQPPIFGPCLLWPNGCPSQLLLSTCLLFVLL